MNEIDLDDPPWPSLAEMGITWRSAIGLIDARSGYPILVRFTPRWRHRQHRWVRRQRSRQGLRYRYTLCVS